MTTKQWINKLTDADCKEIYALCPWISLRFSPIERRTEVRNSLRKYKITQRHLNIQKGTWAARKILLSLEDLLLK